MKSIPKRNVSFNFDYLPFSTVLDRKANTTIWILKQVTLFLLLIFFGFPFFRFSCVHLFCVLCFLKWTVSHVVFVYHSETGIYSCSPKLLFSYPPQVFLYGYGQEVYIATLQNNYFSCRAVSGCIQVFN